MSIPFRVDVNVFFVAFLRERYSHAFPQTTVDNSDCKYLSTAIMLENVDNLDVYQQLSTIYQHFRSSDEEKWINILMLDK